MANNGQAVAFDEAIPQPNEPIQMRPRGKILGPRGDTLRPKEAHTFMAKLDEKGSQEITLRRSTLWFAGTGIALAAVVFSYGSSVISWARADESQKMQILQLQNDVTSVKDSVQALKELIEKEREARVAQEIQNAKALGYQLKAAEGPEHGAQK